MAKITGITKRTARIPSPELILVGTLDALADADAEVEEDVPMGSATLRDATATRTLARTSVGEGAGANAVVAPMHARQMNAKGVVCDG